VNESVCGVRGEREGAGETAEVGVGGTFGLTVSCC
jgi:hypothetical protein